MYQENITVIRKILTNPNNLVIFEVDSQKKEVKANYAEISQLQAHGKREFDRINNKNIH